MNINLHIERLVLDGVNIASGQRRLLQATVESELTRLLKNGGFAPSLAEGVALPKLSTASIQLAEAGSPKPIGQQIANSVYGGIGHQ